MEADAHALVIQLAPLEVKCAKPEEQQQKGTFINQKSWFETLCSSQFAWLKNWRMSRYDSKALNHCMETSGEIQQLFSEVHRVRKLLELGKSVCKVIVSFDMKVDDFFVGTGFVLFDNFILTSAHYFTGCVGENKLKDNVNVFAIFDYEEPQTNTDFYYFRAKNTFIDFDAELDYAVLELNSEGSNPNLPGLLSKFGPLPDNGEACIIGHPAGRVKQMNPTRVIKPETETENTQQATDEKLRGLFIIQLISDYVRKKDIENILHDAKKREMESTHGMYHGASGSPVFDGSGRVFGLHIAGFTGEFTENVQSVTEYARPLITIFEKFVSNLRKGNNDLLRKVEKEAEGNDLLTMVLNTEQEAP